MEGESTSCVDFFLYRVTLSEGCFFWGKYLYRHHLLTFVDAFSR